MASSKTFEGAETTAYNMSYSVGNDMSPDYELDKGDTLKSLRRIVKQLIKDNTVAACVQQAFINLIGTPAIRYISEDETKRDQLNGLLAGVNSNLTFAGYETFEDVLTQIVAWSFADGDILISLPIDKKRSGIKTVVELIEANRVGTPSDLTKKEKDLVKLGVQYDVEGRVEGYWVKKVSEIDSGKNQKSAYDFFPAYRKSGGLVRRTTMLFKAPLNSRPKMSRQYPILAPAIKNLKNLKDYKEAVIIGARVAACFAGFVTTAVPHGTYTGATTDANGAVYDPLDPGQRRRVQKLQPGMISYLKPNESIDFASPNRPGDNADPFIVRQHKEIAACVRIAYPILFLDLVETSYTSLRGGALETSKTIKRWRDSLSYVLNWIYETIAYEAVVTDQVDGDYDDISVGIRWASNGILDQEKEGRAAKLRLENATASKRLIDEEQGLVYDEIEKERREEEIEEVHHQAEVLKLKKEYEEKYGIIFPDTKQPSESPEDRQRDLREGEDSDGDGELTEEEKRKRRKDDGNW